MGAEIERKFLVIGTEWKRDSAGLHIRQGYLCHDPERVVRVRLAGETAWITIKGKTDGITRVEFEYGIPRADAACMLDVLCHKPIIEKTRHTLRHAAHTWEIDEFHGANRGLVVAEVELGSEDEPFARPPWLGREVSDDARYFNSNLGAHPFGEW